MTMRTGKYISYNRLWFGITAVQEQYRLDPNSICVASSMSSKSQNSKFVSCHGDTVLVTGGAGFLGQHIISLLQTEANHVQHIKILDLKHYKNYLGHPEGKSITSITGNITDQKLLANTFAGVHSVYHVAGHISYGTFPDFDTMYKVNVEGTRNVIKACLENGVQRLIFCSTVDVVVGYKDIENGDEETTTVPQQFLFPGYPDSKNKAESLVLNANGKIGYHGVRLQTVSLRANVMYGEGDPYYITNGLRSAKKSWNVLYCFGDGSALFQPAYVGNTAWAFICADNSLRKDPTAGGNFYFIPDDTPIQNTFDFMRPFLEVKGYRLSSFRVPFRVIYPLFLIAEMFVKAFAPLYKIHLPTESYSIKYLNMNLYLKNDRARQELGYKPLFPYETAIKRSLPFYRDVKL